jgi:hypothetical protein
LLFIAGEAANNWCVNLTPIRFPRDM